VYFGLVLRVLALRRILGVGDALTFDDALAFFGGAIELPPFAGVVGFATGGRLPGQ
jgi:hypothetical protein